MGFTALAVGSLVAQGVGSVISAGAQSRAAEQQYLVAQRNAEIAAQQASYNAAYSSAVAENQAAFANFDASLALRNAKAAQNNAEAAIKEANEKAYRQRREKEQAIGRMRSQYARSGVVESGSAIEVLGDSAGVYETGIRDTNRAGLATYQNYQEQAANFKTQAQRSQAQAQFHSYESERALYAGQIEQQQIDLNLWDAGNQYSAAKTNAGATLLSGATGVSSSFLQYRDAGAFKGLGVA